MKPFTLDMTIQEVIENHPRAQDALAGLHLGGCAHCAIGEFETLGQVAESYGVPNEVILDVLNSLQDQTAANVEEPKQ